MLLPFLPCLKADVFLVKKAGNSKYGDTGTAYANMFISLLSTKSKWYRH